MKKWGIGWRNEHRSVLIDRKAKYTGADANKCLPVVVGGSINVFRITSVFSVKKNGH